MAGTRHTALRIGAAAGMAAAAIAASALAATGDLTPKGCIDDQPPGGPDNCVESEFGLDAVDSVAVSPDGRYVYATSTIDDAIVRFKRDTQTGALTPKGCMEDTGQDECVLESPGLDGPRSIAVSPDGKSLYVASYQDDAIVRFKRDLHSGGLTEKGCVEDTGQDECEAETPGLAEARAVTVSPDGKSVYAAGAVDDAIVRFKRDTQTGALTPKGCIEDTGQDECDQETPGLGMADQVVESVVVSPDGRSVYVAASADGAIVRFTRDTQTGALTPKSCIEDTAGQDECEQETPGLDDVQSIAVSPDGKSVYATSYDDDAIVRFKRDPHKGQKGVLTPKGCIEDTGQDECNLETPGLATPHSITVSPDGRSVYATSVIDDAIVRFKRDAQSGALTPKGCVEDTGQDECQTETPGLGQARWVAVSPDGTSVYVAAFSDDAIVRFKRAP